MPIPKRNIFWRATAYLYISSFPFSSTFSHLSTLPPGVITLLCLSCTARVQEYSTMLLELSFFFRQLVLTQERPTISLVCLHLDRKSNISICTTNKLLRGNICDLDEEVSFSSRVAAKDSTTANEETAKLVLKGYSREKEKVVILGFVVLQLAQLFAERGTQHMSLKLMDSKGGNVGTLNTTITVKPWKKTKDHAASSAADAGYSSIYTNPKQSRTSPPKSSPLTMNAVYKDTAATTGSSLHELDSSQELTDRFRLQVHGRLSPQKETKDQFYMSNGHPTRGSESTHHLLVHSPRSPMSTILTERTHQSMLMARSTALEEENARLQAIVDAISAGISAFVPETDPTTSSRNFESGEVIERVGMLKAQKIAIEEKLQLLKARLDSPTNENSLAWKQTMAELSKERKRASTANDQLTAIRQEVETLKMQMSSDRSKHQEVIKGYSEKVLYY